MTSSHIALAYNKMFCLSCHYCFLVCLSGKMSKTKSLFIKLEAYEIAAG